MFYRVKIPYLEQSGQLSLVKTLKTAGFLAVAMIVVFASVGNSLTWHLQRIWGASANFWEALWGKVCDIFNDNEAAIATVGLTIYFAVLFWFINFFFLLVDFFEWPSFIVRFKVQPKQHFTMSEFWKAVRTVLFNKFILGPPFLYLSYLVMKWRGCSFGRELPSFDRVVIDLAVFVVVEEIGFYYTHRLVHMPFFYKHVHKKHHEWTAPIGIICIYAHPFEFIVSSMIPMAAGAWIMGSHCATFWLWISLALFTTIVHHCGYHLPFLTSPEFHDFHHLKFTNCFGVLGFLDRLHGTDEMFVKSKQYERHYTYIGLAPPRELVPDEQNNRKSTKAK